VVEQSLQDVYYICFCIDWEELHSELLLKVNPGLKEKDASVCFLSREVFGLFCGLASCYEMVPRKETISYIFINLVKNI